MLVVVLRLTTLTLPFVFFIASQCAVHTPRLPELSHAVACPMSDTCPCCTPLFVPSLSSLQQYPLSFPPLVRLERRASLRRTYVKELRRPLRAREIEEGEALCACHLNSACVRQAECRAARDQQRHASGRRLPAQAVSQSVQVRSSQRSGLRQGDWRRDGRPQDVPPAEWHATGHLMYVSRSEDQTSGLSARVSERPGEDASAETESEAGEAA